MIRGPHGRAPLKAGPSSTPWAAATWPLQRTDLLTAAALAAVLLALAIWHADLDPVVVAAWAIGVASVAGIAGEWSRGRLLSLEVGLYVFALTSFCIRPLYLWGLRTQLAAHEYPRSVDAQLENLTSLELANLVTNRLPGQLEKPFLLALAVGAAFFATFAAGRWLARSWGDGRLPAILVRPPARTMARLIGVFLAIGLTAQLASVAGLGGGLLAKGSFEGAILVRFAVIGLLLWAAYGPLRGPAGLAFVGVVLAFAVLRGAGGSRTEALLPVVAIFIVIHVARRPFRARELIATFIAVIMVANVVLTTRTVAHRRPVSEALVQGLSKATSLKVAQGDNSQFDDFLILTIMVPERFPHANGGRLAAGVASSLPGPFISGKPEQNEQTFRKLVWGDLYDAGRPYTLPGEFWFDFGWIGVILGGLGLGAVAGRYRMVGIPLRRGEDPGPAVLAAVIISLVFPLGVGGTYSMIIAATITFAIPLATAAIVMRRAHARSDALVSRALMRR